MRSFVFKIAVAAAAVAALPVSANAAIVIGSVTPGTVPYSGPPPTFDFDSLSAPVSGGKVTNASVSGVSAQPLGSTGNFWTVGPTDGAIGIMDLTSFGDIYNISFIWGSVDAYNTIEFLDAGGGLLKSFTGSDIFNPANGDQTSPNLNPVVRFNLTDSDVTGLARLRLTSSSNAFETDNFTINAVPEPATWAMMLLGFGLVGFGMRRRREFTSPSFA